MKKTLQKIKLFLFEKEGLTGILIPIIAGIIIFFAVKLCGGKNYLFWGIATSYWVFGGFINEITSFLSFRFEKTNIWLAIILIVISIVGLINGWRIIGGPTLTVGIVIILSALYGVISKEDERHGYRDYRRPIVNLKK